MRITQILRLSDKNCRVMLDDGRTCKLPTTLAVLNSELEEEFYQEVEGVVYHKSLIKPKRVKVSKPLLRTLDNFDAKSELGLIKTLLGKWLIRYNVSWNEEQIDNFSVDVITHFWEKDYYRTYDASRLAYNSYISVGVRNYLLDLLRSKNRVKDIQPLSLNRAVGEDGLELQDLLVDGSCDVERTVFDGNLILEVRKTISRLDEEEPIGLEGLTYSKLFNLLINGGTVKQIGNQLGYSEMTIQRRKNVLDEFIQPILSDYADTSSYGRVAL